MKKIITNLYFFFLICAIIFPGCETPENEKDIEKSVSSAEIIDFEHFFKPHISDLNKVLINHKMNALLSDSLNEISWELYRRDNLLYAGVIVPIIENLKIIDMRVPTYIYVRFIKVNEKWNLSTEDGYVESIIDEEDALNFPPEFHVDLKNVFPNKIDLILYFMGKNNDG